MEYENIDYNIFKSMDNVNLNSILGYKLENERYHFIDNYENIDKS